MKKLPAHTTLYFARNAYWSVVHYGTKGPWKHKTVQGVDLTVEYVRDPVRDAMVCTYNIGDKEIQKVHLVCKSWAY